MKRHRSLAAAAIAGLFLLGALGTEIAAGDPAQEGAGAADSLARAHIGPVSLTDFGPTGSINIGTVNLTETSQRITLTLFDQDGMEIAERRPVLGPGESRTASAQLVPAIQAVRGRILYVGGDAGVFRLSLWVQDGTSNTILFSDHTVGQRGLLEGRASTALLPVDAEGEVTVTVANLRQSPATYRLQLLDATGDVVRSRLLRDVPPRSLRGEEWRDLGVDFARAEVIGPQGSVFLGTAQVSSQGGDGLLLGNVLTA